MIYYDDLDPHSLNSGFVQVSGTAYGALWRRCRESGLEVIGDVHTHPGAAHQSETDRKNPMLARAGHIAIIVPFFATNYPRVRDLGVFEYLGEFRWNDQSGPDSGRFLYIGRWG